MRRVVVAMVALALGLTGCGTDQYLVGSTAAPLPAVPRAYQQAVEQRYQALTQNLNQAIRAEEQVVTQDPRYAPGFVRLGGLFLMAGQPQGSLEALAKAVSLDPQNAKDWLILGQVEAGLGRMSAASKAYRRALLVNPAVWQAWDGLGFLAVAAGHHRMAWRDAQSALLTSGEEGPTLDLMGRVLYAEGDAATALTYFDDAQHVESLWWQSYYDGARADLVLGDARAAITNLDRALNLDPANAAVFDLLTRITRK